MEGRHGVSKARPGRYFLSVFAGCAAFRRAMLRFKAAANRSAREFCFGGCLFGMSCVDPLQSNR
jgi:hypothetical protein